MHHTRIHVRGRTCMRMRVRLLCIARLHGRTRDRHLQGDYAKRRVTVNSRIRSAN